MIKSSFLPTEPNTSNTNKDITYHVCPLQYTKTICHHVTRVCNNKPTCTTCTIPTCTSPKLPFFPISLCFSWNTEDRKLLFFFLLFLPSSYSFFTTQVFIFMAFSLRTKTFTFTEGESPLQSFNEIHYLDQWQRGIYYTLCAAYATVSFIALVRLFHSKS